MASDKVSFCRRYYSFLLSVMSFIVPYSEDAENFNEPYSRSSNTSDICLLPHQVMDLDWNSTIFDNKAKQSRSENTHRQNQINRTYRMLSNLCGVVSDKGNAKLVIARHINSAIFAFAISSQIYIVPLSLKINIRFNVSAPIFSLHCMTAADRK